TARRTRPRAGPTRARARAEHRRRAVGGGGVARPRWLDGDVVGFGEPGDAAARRVPGRRRPVVRAYRRGSRNLRPSPARARRPPVSFAPGRATSGATVP